MTNPIQAMLEAGIVEVTDFPPSSRWHGVAQVSIIGPDGREIRHLRRRFPPDPDAFATTRERRVVSGDRLDQVAFEELGDPEAFWVICDANGAIFADELEELGRTIRITLPQGLAAHDEGA